MNPFRTAFASFSVPPTFLLSIYLETKERPLLFSIRKTLVVQQNISLKQRFVVEGTMSWTTLASITSWNPSLSTKRVGLTSRSSKSLKMRGSKAYLALRTQCEGTASKITRKNKAFASISNTLRKSLARIRPLRLFLIQPTIVDRGASTSSKIISTPIKRLSARLLTATRQKPSRNQRKSLTSWRGHWSQTGIGSVSSSWQSENAKWLSDMPTVSINYCRKQSNAWEEQRTKHFRCEKAALTNQIRKAKASCQRDLSSKINGIPQESFVFSVKSNKSRSAPWM